MTPLTDRYTIYFGDAGTEISFAVILITVIYSTFSEDVSELALGSPRENACSFKIMSEAKEQWM